MTIDTIFCTQCGARNPASAHFCDQCGAQLVKPGAAPLAPSQPQAQAPLPVVGFTCQQCGVPAIPGEAFCDNCGAPLEVPSLGAGGAPPPQASYPPPQPVPAAESRPTIEAAVISTVPAAPPMPQPSAPTAVTPVRVALAPARLQVESTGAFVALPASASALIGRADPASSFYPDVDLTPYGALENGVGRRHLRLAIENGRISVEDLDSTNGSALNGQRLAPRQVYPLSPGDTLMVGRLALRLID